MNAIELLQANASANDEAPHLIPDVDIWRAALLMVKRYDDYAMLEVAPQTALRASGMRPQQRNCLSRV